MARLPIPGQDSGTWGDLLNDYLSQVHQNDGTLKTNSVTASSLADNAVTAAHIADGSITETLLAPAVQTKLNTTAGTPGWSDITGKPAVIAAGADQATARQAIGAGTSSLVLGTTNTTAKAGDWVPTKADVGLGNVDNTSDATKWTASATLTNKTLTNPTINNYTEGVVTIGTVTTTHTLSLTSGTVQTATLTASTGCTFTMPAPVAGKSFTLMLKQAASTGNGTATFTGVKWAGNQAPTITAGAGSMDILSFFSDGTNWYGGSMQGFVP